MFNFDEFFFKSGHGKTIFDEDTLHAISDIIFIKNVKGNDAPYVHCQVRDRDIKLTPEEAVRQMYIYVLTRDYNYPTTRMELERHDLTIILEDARQEERRYSVGLLFLSENEMINYEKNTHVLNTFSRVKRSIGV